MALSQCIEDSPGCIFPKKRNDLNFQELYNERHRLALEELVSRGRNGFLDFLKKERIPNFLSDDEMQRITRTAKVPRCGSMHGDDPNFEQSASTSMDCSSVTYFPEISDVEPPLLEIGWPAFTAGSYRGVTRAVAHFQPSYGECIYSCKDAARRMIKSAREVIAIVTDSMTDLDVFKDLQEACVQRKVPVYILLDQSSAPAFLQMCSNTKVRLDDLQLMRVRTITGTTYFMRSGARITGKVHERFMLIDGNRAATGSYRFNWTDGKLNSSNLIELSGQITEHFDEEFRILYAQSLPLSARAPPGVHDSSVSHHHHHLLPLLRQPHATTTTPPASPVRTGGPGTPMCLTSTPNHGPRAPPPVTSPLPGVPACRSSPPSESSTVANEWVEPRQGPAVGSPVGQCHVSTQTEGVTVSSDTQTESEPPPAQPPPSSALPAPSRPPGSPMSRGPPGPSSWQGTGPALPAPVVTGATVAAAGASLRDRFHGLTQERRRHYTAIRTKLDRMASVLAQQRRELADVTNTARAQGGRPRARVGEPGQGEGVGTWPRARCVH